MNIHNEPRDMIEYIIDRYFVKSIENRERFFLWFDSIYYLKKKIKNFNLTDFKHRLNIDKLEKDMFESYSYFFYEYYTTKYLVNTNENELTFNDVIDFCSDIIERKNDHYWLEEIQDNFKIEDYIIY